MKYVIVAHTNIQASLFARNNGLKRSEFRYAGSPRVLLGIRDVVVIFLDGWSRHPYSLEIADLIKAVDGHCGVTVLRMKDTDLLEEKPKTVVEEMQEHPDPLGLWFELSYAQFLTIPRLVMQSMSPEWQAQMAALLFELDETFDWRPKEGRYWVKLRDDQGRFADAPLNDYRRGSCEHLRRPNIKPK